MPQTVINYALLNSLNYKFKICKINHEVYDSLAYYHKENFPDIEIIRENIETDLLNIHNKYLITINGYVYNTVYSNSKLYVPNATKSMLKSRSNSIGILSFKDLPNNLKKIPITIGNITAENNFTSLFNKVILTFNEEIHIPILILAGYMIFEDSNIFYRVSPNSYALKIDKINYIEKLYELYRYRNIFSELEVPVSTVNPSLIDGTLVKSDATIIKFLTLFNSFIINLPINNLILEKIYLERTSVPGNFRTEIEPKYPLIAGYGKICEYLKKKNNDIKFTVYTNDAYYNNHLFSNLPSDTIDIYNDHREVTNTYRLSPAYFRKIILNY